MTQEKCSISAKVPKALKLRLKGTAVRDHSDESKTMTKILDERLPPLKAVKKFIN